MHDEEGAKYMSIFVGCFFGVGFIGLLMSAFKGVYDFFAGAFNSISAMVGGFIHMAWNIGLVAAIVAIAISLVIVIWSFAQSFKKQMDDNADLRSWVKSEVEGSHKLWNLELTAKLKANADLVRALDAKVEAALKKPEVVPEDVATTVVSQPTVTAESPREALATDKTNDVTMSNPF